MLNRPTLPVGDIGFAHFRHASFHVQAAGGLLGIGALLFESREVEWSTTFILTLGWLVLVLSIAAILLLMALIKKGEASRVASLFYLVPPVTALQAWWLFDERLPLMGLIGMVIAIAGVVMVVKSASK